MRFLKFWKKPVQTLNGSPREIIKHVIDYMPDFYKSQRQFVLCVDFWEHLELGLAIESLVELAEETGHYFSEEFWNSISIAACQMELKHVSKICEEQIAKNRKDITWKISFGDVIEKIDDRHFIHRTAQKIKDELDNYRRSEDNVNGLIGKNGVHLKSRGRTGTIYFVSGIEIFEIEYELGVKGLILYFENFIKKKQLESGKELYIKDAIVEWSNNTGNAIEFS